MAMQCCDSALLLLHYTTERISAATCCSYVPMCRQIQLLMPGMHAPLLSTYDDDDHHMHFI